MVDFIDGNRVLVDGADGALSDIDRVSMPMRWIQVTKFRINIERGAESATVKEVVEATQVRDAYNKSVMGRRNQCIQAREELNDFGRFKLHFIKGKYKKAVARELMKLRAEQKGVDVKELYAAKKRRAEVHPALRRVVGRFRTK